MKKKFVVGSAVASTLTASTLTAGLALANQFAKKMELNVKATQLS